MTSRVIDALRDGRNPLRRGLQFFVIELPAAHPGRDTQRRINQPSQTQFCVSPNGQGGRTLPKHCPIDRLGSFAQ